MKDYEIEKWEDYDDALKDVEKEDLGTNRYTVEITRTIKEVTGIEVSASSDDGAMNIAEALIDARIVERSTLDWTLVRTEYEILDIEYKYKGVRDES